MTNRNRWGMAALLLVASGPILILSTPTESAADAPEAGQPAAVEDDMHEFMEYVFEPPYKRLKAVLAGESADRAAWKGIKSDSLILAESANLLLHRPPAERAQQWQQNAKQVRQQGAELYGAAKKRDFDLTRKHFATMLKKCNQCHDEFAEGKHQLAP